MKSKISNPIVKPITWFDQRFYAYNNGKEIIWLPSVTTKLGIVAKDEWLERRRGDLGNREYDLRLQEAADRGSRVHHACNILINGGAVAYINEWNKAQTIDEATITKLKRKYKNNLAILQSQEEQVAVWRFKQWIEKNKPKIIGYEIIVYSLQHNYAGTIDWLFRFDDNSVDKKGLWIVDLKTGIESDTHRMQLAAYTIAYEETYGEKISGSMIIYLNGKKAGGLEKVNEIVITREEIEKDFSDFLAVSKLWDRKYANLKPVVFEFPAIITMDNDNKPTKTNKKKNSKKRKLIKEINVETEINKSKEN